MATPESSTGPAPRRGARLRFAGATAAAAVVLCVGAPAGVRALWRTAADATASVADDADDATTPYGVKVVRGVEARRVALAPPSERARLRALAPFTGPLFEALAATPRDATLLVATPRDPVTAVEMLLAATYFFPRTFRTVPKDPETWGDVVGEMTRPADFRAIAEVGPSAPLYLLDLDEPIAEPRAETARAVARGRRIALWRVP